MELKRKPICETLFTRPLATSIFEEKETTLFILREGCTVRIWILDKSGIQIVEKSLIWFGLIWFSDNIKKLYKEIGI